MNNSNLTTPRLRATIVKVGGTSLQSEQDLSSLARHIRWLQGRNLAPILVHGGGTEISAFHKRLGVPFEKHEGLRVTTPDGMEITTMVLCGLVNKRVVSALRRQGLRALGLSGMDDGLIQATAKNEAVWGRVGTPVATNTGLLRDLVRAGYVPIVAPVSVDERGEALNVNADEAAVALATGLGASTLDFVSDIPGVRGDDDKVMARLDCGQIENLIAARTIKGGMVPKIQAALAAVQRGVLRARIGDLDAMRNNRATTIVATIEEAM